MRTLILLKKKHHFYLPILSHFIAAALMAEFYKASEMQ